MVDDSMQLACSSLSLVACLLVLLCYAGTPSLSRFPSSMMFWRFVCDCVLSVQFVLLSLEVPCSPALAFVTQFAMFGSLSWCAPPAAFWLSPLKKNPAPTQ